MAELSRTDRLLGVLIGTAVGDSIGLPFEGMKRPAVQRRCVEGLRHRLLFGRGMISDDTEHTVLVAQALLKSAGDAMRFKRSLARRLKAWSVLLPAGCGRATAEACARLWVGFSPDRSGVSSAGNGPAMRAAILGAYYAADPDSLGDRIHASTRMTHTDPRAETAALAVARLAALGEVDGERAMAVLGACGEDEEWRGILQAMGEALQAGESVADFVRRMGWGEAVSGYAYQSVPLALYAWMRHPGDPETAITEVVRCGGDTDSSAAIAGGLFGARLGRDAFPDAWVRDLHDWPLSTRYLERLAVALAADSAPPHFAWWGLPARNLFFLVVVLTHGLMRLLTLGR